MQLSFLVFVFLFSLPAFATLLEPEGTPAYSITVEGKTVPIYRQARVVGTSDTDAMVYLTGAGVRRKKMLFFNVNVYVAASYTTNPQGISATDPIGSLAETEVDAIQLTLVRDLTAEEIRSSLENSLDANDVDPNAPHVRELLDKISYDLKYGSTITFASETRNGLDAMHVEHPKGTFITEHSGVALDFWKVFFGVPADNGLAELKKKLLGLRYWLTGDVCEIFSCDFDSGATTTASGRLRDYRRS